MFTKYNGLEIPKNYSGNRFKALSETEMKTHKVTHSEILQGATKSSVSPKFQEVIDQTVNNIADVEDIEPVPEQEDEESYSPPNKEERALTVTDEASPDLSLTALLDKIRKDDLLLIALIILFASDSSMSNYDTVIILALLLLYH